MAKIAAPADRATEPARPEELQPAPGVDLGRAGRAGIVGGVAAIFVCAVGMVAAFEGRGVVAGVTFAYVLLAAVPLVSGYVAGRPPPQLEGFEPPRPGPRNAAAGVLAGAVAGALLAAFMVVIDNFDIRAMFTNVSPELLDVLALGLGTGVAGASHVAVGGLLGGVGGATHLLPERARKAAIMALTWVVVFGLLEDVVKTLMDGIDVDPLIGVMYASEGGLTLVGGALVAVALFALYWWLGRKRTPLRERLESLPEGQRRRVTGAALAVLLLVLVVLPRILGVFLSEVLDVAGIFLLMALGLNIVVGYAGLLDLGYVAFFAVGAYTTAVLTSPDSEAFSPELTFLLALPFVFAGAAVAGTLVGTPVIRMRGDYLAIVTLGFGEIARLLFLSEWLTPVFGGAQGIINIPDLSIGPIVLQGPQAYFYAIFGFALVAAYVSYALQDSRIGRAWMAMREDESVAEAMGVNIVTAKLSAFFIGAILAGCAGALFAVKIGSVFPHSFDIVVSITVVALIIIGGLASIPGVVVGALVLVGLPELLREFAQFRYLIYGALLIFMMLNRPEGFIPSRRRAQELHEEEALQDAWLREEQQAQEKAAPAPAEA
jgi:branched-chain amino acid transport system permease protein